MVGKIRLMLAIVAMTAAILWGTADASEAPPTFTNQECEAWAGQIEATVDDVRMKSIGCEEGFYADNFWLAADGQCAELARDMFRTYRNLQTVVMQVKYYDPTCEAFDDGSWAR